MVSFPLMHSSNEAINATFPTGLTAVFVGATNGIGETSLREFARYTSNLKPEVYFVGRSKEAGDRIAKECKAVNASGKFAFIQADVSLMRTIDDVCGLIKSDLGEKGLNLLFLTQGTLQTGIETSEGLHLPAAVVSYGRTRFALNLLPLLQKASGLRRVVSVFVGGKEGPVDVNNFQGRNLGARGLMAFRGHGGSIATLSMEKLARKAPNVSFIHSFPGPVKSGIARGNGIGLFVLRTVASVLGPLMYIPLAESGERHVYLSTSQKYPAAVEEKTSTVSLGSGVQVAKGTDGKIGSGVYTVDEHGEPAGEDVDQILAKLRQDGTADKIWQDIESEFQRTTGRVQV